MGKTKLALNNKKISQSIENAQSWLLSSGIQNSKINTKLYGSINAWYNPKNKKYSFVYSEINGYFLTLMVFFYKNTKNKIYLDKAIDSAKWLIKNAQFKNGGFKCLFAIDKTSPHTFKENLIYSFDNGVILSGLCSLYKITKKKFLFHSANKCANWIVHDCLDKNYNIKPVYHVEDNKFYESDKEWSTTSGSYHTKVAIGLLNYYSISKKKIFKIFAEKICLKSISYQESNGRFISFPFKGGTNAHPHCYSAEGLWSVGTYLNNKKYLKSSFKATKWIVSKMNNKGLIPRLFLDKKPIYYERIDAIAQVIRLNFLHLNKKKKIILTAKKLEKLVSILLSYQNKNKKNLKTFGSFLWGKKSSGVKVNHANSWVTFFAIQGLYLLKYFQKNKKIKFDPFDIV